MSNMKIDYALMGSDTNPMYLDFWPIVSKVWKKKFNITPVLGLITNEKEEIIHDEHGLIIKINPIQNYEISLLTQLVRLYLPKFLNGNCIISDIDMIPLSQEYFIDNLSKYDEDSLLVMSSNHPQTVNVKQFPMCYVAANDKTFKRIFNLEDSWQEFITKIQNNGWYTDQLYLYDKIMNSVGYDIILMERDDSYTLRRIDRGSWSYEEVKLKNGYYIDCHSLRPVSSHQKEINKLINILLDE
jgi:hypothetical protein